MSTDTENETKRWMLDRQQCAAAVYHDLKDSQRATFTLSAEYGRWLLASLYLMHGGALFGLFSFLGDVAQNPALLERYASAVWWFVAGLLLAMLSGFMAWLNWSMHSNNYDHNANLAMLWDPKVWIGKSPHTTALDVTNWACTACGFLSAFCTIGGADAIVSDGSMIEYLTTHSEYWFPIASDTVLAVGLLLTVIGAGITAKAVILSEDDAITIGTPRWASDKREENLSLPSVQNLLKSSKAAKRGLWTIAWGTGLQLGTILVKPIIWLLG